jgi:2'-5' RNA ligase
MRLFVALCLPTEALHALETLQDRLPVGRPVPADNLHLTLAFLGEVDDTAAEALHDALSNPRAAPVVLALGGAEVFGGRHGQAIALGAEGGPPCRTCTTACAAAFTAPG